MLWAQCSPTLHQHRTVAIGQTRKMSRIEFPIVLCVYVNVEGVGYP